VKISLEETHEWLNVINPTNLSLVSREMIDALRTESLSDRNVDHLIKELLEQTQKSIDPLEYAEALTHCAVIRAARGEYKSALGNIQKAVPLYKSSQYKFAVALWMQGWIEWRLQENRKAYIHWTDAKEILKSLVKSLTTTRRAEYFQQIPWYLERIEDMSLELVRHAEEAYSWINWFEPSHLGQTGLGFRELLDQKIAENKGASVYQVMQALQNQKLNIPDNQAAPEMLVEAGLAAHQLGIEYESEMLLKQAIGLFRPESHQQASVYWMLGAVQLAIKGKTLEAIQNWERSIEIFERIPQRLKTRQRQAYKNWLLEMLPVFQKALDRVIHQTV